MIRECRAEALSERDTTYLGAGTKAANSSVMRPQFGDGPPAKPRAYTFKKGFVTYLVNTLLRRQAEDAENKALPDSFVGDFEGEILSRFRAFVGNSVADICERLDEQPPKSAKNFNAWLTRRMLGVKGNKIAEFEKADIVTKTVHLDERGRLPESMSFPVTRFDRLVAEEWLGDAEITGDATVLTSAFRAQLDKRFLFVVFRGDRNNRASSKFVGAFFWSMPPHDLDGEVQRVWHVMRQAVTDSSPARFPKESESRIAHVRPHARNAADVDTLPNGTTTTKRCFWLNRGYILAQVREHLPTIGT
jgi:hypothetical protein